MKFIYVVAISVLCLWSIGCSNDRELIEVDLRTGLPRFTLKSSQGGLSAGGGHIGEDSPYWVERNGNRLITVVVTEKSENVRRFEISSVLSYRLKTATKVSVVNASTKHFEIPKTKFIE